MFHLPRLVFPGIARQPLLVSLEVKDFVNPVFSEGRENAHLPWSNQNERDGKFKILKFLNEISRIAVCFLHSILAILISEELCKIQDRAHLFATTLHDPTWI